MINEKGVIPINPYQNFINQTNPQAYNNYGYNNNYQPMTNKQEIIQVNGLEGARAYQMQPSSRAILLDEKEPIVYIKCSDGGNFSTINAYKLLPIEEKKEVEKEQKGLEEIEKRLNELEKQIGEIINVKSNTKQPTSTTKSSEQSRKHT